MSKHIVPLRLADGRVNPEALSLIPPDAEAALRFLIERPVGAHLHVLLLEPANHSELVDEHGSAILNIMLSARLDAALRRVADGTMAISAAGRSCRILRFETRLKRPTTVGKAWMQLARLQRLSEVPALQLFGLAWGDRTLIVQNLAQTIVSAA